MRVESHNFDRTLLYDPPAPGAHQKIGPPAADRRVHLVTVFIARKETVTALRVAANAEPSVAAVCGDEFHIVEIMRRCRAFTSDEIRPTPPHTMLLIGRREAAEDVSTFRCAQPHVPLSSLSHKLKSLQASYHHDVAAASIMSICQPALF